MKRHGPLRLGVAACALALLLGAGRARAEAGFELRHDVAVSATTTATGFAFVLGCEIAKIDVAPDTCRWCDRDADGKDDLSDVDRLARNALVWREPARAAQISDVLSFLVAPASAFGTLFGAGVDAGTRKKLPIDTQILGETAVVSGFLHEIVKMIVARERPFVHFQNEEAKRGPRALESDVSFYSGHTTFAFTLAAAGGTIATLRGYKLAPLVWAPGAVIGIATGYLRVAADRHYITDVASGAVIGTTMGIMWPVIFHNRRPPDPVDATAVPLTAAQREPVMFTYAGTF